MPVGVVPLVVPALSVGAPTGIDSVDDGLLDLVVGDGVGCADRVLVLLGEGARGIRAGCVGVGARVGPTAAGGIGPRLGRGRGCRLGGRRVGGIGRDRGRGGSAHAATVRAAARGGEALPDRAVGV